MELEVIFLGGGFLVGYVLLWKAINIVENMEINDE